MRQTAPAVSVNLTFAKVSDFFHNIKNISLSIAVPTCNDGVKNANETGVDCGGWCAPQKKCTDLSGCRTSYDCISGVCTLSICQSECSYYL
jgi:hypothetical protein